MQHVRRWCVMALAVSALAQRANAQAWSYPAFQPPRVVEREFNIGVADGGIAGAVSYTHLTLPTIYSV